MANPYAVGALAGFQLISGFQQAELIRENAKITRQVAEMNAQFAEADAWNAEVDGFSQVARYETELQSQMADQKMAFIANDVDTSFGTAKELLAESRLTGFLNTLDIKNQAHERALGFKREARNIRLQGSMNYGASQIQASATQSAALMNTASTVVAGYTRK